MEFAVDVHGPQRMNVIGDPVAVQQCHSHFCFSVPTLFTTPDTV